MLKKVCLATLLAIPAISMAEGLSYNYVEGSYVSSEEGDGYRAAGSFALTPNVFAVAEGSYYDFGSDVTGTEIIGQLGYRHALNPTMDLNVTGGVIYQEVEVGSASANDTGFTFGGLLRAQLAPQLELNGGIQYIDIADSSDVGFQVGAVYAFTPSLAAVGGGRFIDDSETFNIGIRYNF